MEFWNSLLTERSWEILQQLRRKPFHFILIGGWATYLWTRQHKSKDIDIILPQFQDLEYLKQEYDLKKNDFLKKYEISFGEVDVDIYVPHYSHFAVPVSEIAKGATNIEGIPVVTPEILLLLKQAAEQDREHSVKGMKDRVDIMTLVLFAPVHFSRYHQLLMEHHLPHFLPRLKIIIMEFTEIRYLGLNPREFKMRKNKLLEELRK